MKKQILLTVLFFTHFLAKSQEIYTHIDTIEVPKPILVDDSSVGLGITIADNQKYNQKYHPDILISKPSIIESQKDKNGAFYIKAYVNTDNFNVVAANLTKNNHQNYQAFYQFFGTKEIPQITEKRALELSLYYEEWGDLVFLDTDDLNKAKFIGVKFLFFIKEKRTGNIVSKMVLDFNFPKPEPKFLSFEDYIIDTYETRQGENLGVNPGFLADMKKQVTTKNLAPTTFDRETNLPKQLILPSDQNTLLIQFKSLDIIVDSYLEYKMKSDSTFRTSGKGTNPFIILKDLEPGKHTLQVRYPRQQDAVFEYEFEVEPHFTQTTGFKVSLGGLLTILLIGGTFSFKIQRQKRLLKTETAKRNQLQTQIASLRSQLNPHFVFNALNSIQGLVNKNDQEGANIYISKFGSLLRDILDKNDKTTHALAQEIKQLESYLQLEQLRFRFNYQIHIDETINPAEQDFPVMLLQPFAENAIKHGISEKKEAGKIWIRFERNSNSLIVIIKDNGKGFDINAPITGYGINLIQERIDVVNQLYPEQPIRCNYQSTPTEGTTVTLVFTNWL